MTDTQELKAALQKLAEAGQRVRELEEQRAEMAIALKLSLKYWADRQQRYKNRRPVWVEAAQIALAKAGIQ